MQTKDLNIDDIKQIDVDKIKFIYHDNTVLKGVKFLWDVIYPYPNPFPRDGDMHGYVLGKVIVEEHGHTAKFFDGLVLDLNTCFSIIRDSLTNTHENLLSPSKCFLPFADYREYVIQDAAFGWHENMDERFEEKIRHYYKMCFESSLYRQKKIGYERDKHLKFALVDLITRIGNTAWLLIDNPQETGGTQIRKGIFLKYRANDIEFLEAFRILKEYYFVLGVPTDVCEVNPLFEKNGFDLGFDLAVKKNKELKKEKHERILKIGAFVFSGIAAIAGVLAFLSI